MTSNLKPKRKARIDPKHNDYVQALKTLGYDFRMNLLYDGIEINNFPISDALASKIRDQMRDIGYKRYITAMEDAYIAEALDNPYHPVRDYLATLSYDGGNYISQLATYFQDKYGMFHTYLRRWLIGAVAKTYRGTQNPMLVLEGPQNIGKSFFARWICPVHDMYVDAPINPDNKDDLVKLLTKWVWEVSELGATTRRQDRESLKAFISKEVVTVRKPWGRHPITKPPLASFIGTFNDEMGILSDPTGNRRFNISSLTEIDWNYSSDVDINDVWGEAQAAYQNGEPWLLTPKECIAQAAVNENFILTDPIEDLLKKCFTITGNKVDWMRTADILITLQNAGLTGNTRANAMALATTMKRLGFEKYRYNKENGYYGIR